MDGATRPKSTKCKSSDTKKVQRKINRDKL